MVGFTDVVGGEDVFKAGAEVVDSVQKKAFVNFNTLLKVVLIPCREEYRKAQCDLWWSGSDFFSFKQSAKSEIKLLAVYENICMTEARRKLYQPGQSQHLEESEEDSYYNEENDSESQIVSKPKISKKQSLHTVSSIMSLPNMKGKKNLSLLTNFDECMMDEESEDSCLSLCVALEEPGILSTKERASRRVNVPLSHTIITVLSILSFALPLFGYYFIYFH